MSGQLFQLLQGDCLDLLPTLPAGSVDLVLCDLPYGTTRNIWDSVIPLAPLWAEYLRVARPGAAFVFTARQPFAGMLVASQPDLFRHEWVWHKNKATGHLNAKRAPMLAHETVLVFGQGRVTYRPQMTDGHKPVNAFYTRHNGDNYGAGVTLPGGGSTQRYPRTVQSFPVVNNDDPAKVHPTQKPVDLLAYFIRTYSAPGAVVLDNCMGSGSTGLAALQEGRRFIGMESDPSYFAAAQARIADALAPTITPAAG